MVSTATPTHGAQTCGVESGPVVGYRGTAAFQDCSALDAPLNLFEALTHPDESAAWFASMAPDASLLAVLDRLTAAMLGVDGQLDALIAVERHIGLLQARATELLSALDAGDTSKDGFGRDVVAAALRVPPASMRSRMVLARDLTDRLPTTLSALRTGDITLRHAHVLADATRSLTPDTATQVETRVLERASGQTVAEFAASVRRAVLRVTNPAEEETAHAQAVSERRVVTYPAEHGMSYLTAYLSADEAATVMVAVHAIAQETIHPRGGDDRTADQRRADALVGLCAAALSDPHLTRT